MIGKSPDFIIGADIVYEAKSFKLLLDTFKELASPKTRIVIACTDHGNL